MLTIFGACVVTFMMAMYALESRGRRFVLAFANRRRGGKLVIVRPREKVRLDGL